MLYKINIGADKMISPVVIQQRGGNTRITQITQGVLVDTLKPRKITSLSLEEKNIAQKFKEAIKKGNLDVHSTSRFFSISLLGFGMIEGMVLCNILKSAYAREYPLLKTYYIMEANPSRYTNIKGWVEYIINIYRLSESSQKKIYASIVFDQKNLDRFSLAPQTVECILTKLLLLDDYEIIRRLKDEKFSETIGNIFEQVLPDIFSRVNNSEKTYMWEIIKMAYTKNMALEQAYLDLTYGGKEKITGSPYFVFDETRSWLQLQEKTIARIKEELALYGVRFKHL